MKWIVITIVGRPSARIGDFFNSIKFHSDYVEANGPLEAAEAAILPADALIGGYETINRYAFEDKEAI